MPRLTFEEPLVDPSDGDSAKHRREVKRDGVVIALKGATFAIVIALVGAVVLLLTAGSDEPRAESPDVPEIGTSGAPTTSTTPPVAIVAPEVGTQTAEMSVAPTTTTTRPTRPTEPPDNRFAAIGKPCDTPGAYAFTKRYEAVVCAEPGPVWRPMFR